MRKRRSRVPTWRPVSSSRRSPPRAWYWVTRREYWVPLQGVELDAERDTELALGPGAGALDTSARGLGLSDGTSREYGALLLATGADPVRLAVPGSDSAHVFTLRSLADSRAIIARATAEGVKRAVVVGASFIGLEAAAALRTRGLKVCVVGREACPLERVLGPELGAFVRALHEEHGVHFHLGRTVQAIEADGVVLDDGSRTRADLVVVGIGVRPALALAEQAGLQLDRGVVVNRFLETSAPGVWAAGDIARFPDTRSGESVRIEHWVVAGRQGQTAARNILGRGEPFTAGPFFWSQHYDVGINYLGHAERWGGVDVPRNLAHRSCGGAHRSRGRIAAIASVYRDAENLRAEAMLERDDQAGPE